jgi:hypothetical protein
VQTLNREKRSAQLLPARQPPVAYMVIAIR